MAGSAWFFLALLSAVSWGASYALAEKAMKDYSLAPSFIFLAQGIMFFIPNILLATYFGTIKDGLNTIFTNHNALIVLLAMTALNLIGAYAIFVSISMKNASLSNLIEVSYPFFTIIFAWLLTKEMQISPATLAGGVLIFAGIAVIYLKG